MSDHVYTATVIGLDRDEEDGTLLLRARCDRCRETVLHSAGSDLEDVQLGWREGHCDCDEYELIDPRKVVPLRLRTLRRQDADLRAHAPIAARRRRIEDAEANRDRVIFETRHMPADSPERIARRKEARDALAI